MNSDNNSNTFKVSPIQGIRFQLLRSLRELNAGQKMVVRYQTGAQKWLQDNFGESAKSQQELKKLNNIEFWKSIPFDELSTLFLPGTGYPEIIGKVLLQYGWVEPNEEVFDECFFRNYVISYQGKRSLQRGEQWWKSRSLLGKVLAQITE